MSVGVIMEIFLNKKINERTKPTIIIFTTVTWNFFVEFTKKNSVAIH